MLQIDPGSDEYALKLYDALTAIELLETYQIPILGGDFLSEESVELRYTYDNWYCQKKGDEL